jgi:quercetin dioxygenase-like cupin family protein
MTTACCATLIGLAMAAAAYAAGEAAPVTMTPDQLKWAPAAVPGVMTAVAWGDPAKGAHGAFHKFDAGWSAPLHTHSANTKIVVISGTMAMVGEDGKEMKFPAGSFYTQPNTYKHITKCLAGAPCMVYLEADGAWDMKPVAK